MKSELSAEAERGQAVQIPGDPHSPAGAGWARGGGLAVFTGRHRRMAVHQNYENEGK